MLDNRASRRFSPITGVLQGSILSPFLYSIYINQLASRLRLPDQLTSTTQDDFSTFVPAINCLLYADGAVLIASSEKLQHLLLQCEIHSYTLAFRWNPLKCVVVAPTIDTSNYQLYGTTIPKESSFSYLGIPIKAGGLLYSAALIQQNINKASRSMNQLDAIGVTSKDFSPLLASRFYSQIVRAQIEYGLVKYPRRVNILKKTVINNQTKNQILYY